MKIVDLMIDLLRGFRITKSTNVDLVMENKGAKNTAKSRKHDLAGIFSNPKNTAKPMIRNLKVKN